MIAMFHFNVIPFALPLILTATLFLAGCATKIETVPEPPTQTKAAEPADTSPKGPAVSGSRSGSSQSPVHDSTALAPGFTRCINGVTGMGPVQLGMTPDQVRRAAPWLDLDADNSAKLSASIATLCGERVWEYTVRFDADCRVRSVRMTGPQRMERVFENICSARSEVEDGILTPFKWRCNYGSSEFSVVAGEQRLNVYTLFWNEEPDGTGRCMLPNHWN